MKALRTAAFVVGAAALVATGVGAAVGGGLIAASTIGVSAATLSTVGAALSATAGVLSIAAAAAAPKGTVGGNATKFKIDKEAGIPVMLGRSWSGGNVVHRQYYNNPTSKMKNQLESWVTVHSLGPVKSIGPLQIDKSPVAFNAAGAAIGSFAGNMWLRTQLGACPEPAALTGPFGAFPGWGASSKLSGLAADIWSLDFDSKGEKFPNGVPERGRVIEGVYVYDPRQDSTYPGGAGACRLGQPSTYVYSQNPGPHAITWAYGHYQNGVLMAGGGLPASGLDLAPFVEWSNVCDANGWTVGGLVYTTTDDGWDVLKMICQAGSAEPLPVGAQLSLAFSAPRVSIGTITSNDVMGDVDVPATVSRRLRRNTIIPSVRLETHGWEMVPLDPVVVPDYVAIDGGSRPKEVSYPLIQDAKQGAQVALYEMLNARELDGIVVPAKVYALGYRPGDCITLQIPEANLIGRDVVVRQREIDGGTLGATLTCRTETAGKHDFALGKTGTPPPTPDLSNPGIDRSPPDADDWSVEGTTLSADGVATPALVIIGHADRISADEVIFDYRPYIAGAAPDVNWTGASLEPATVTRKEIASVTASTQYEVGVRYRMRGAVSDRLILGPVTTGGFEGVGGQDGASAFALINVGNCTFPSPSSIAKVAGSGNDWVGKARTAEFSTGSASVSGKMLIDTFIGLTTDPSADTSYGSIDYGLHLSSDRNLFSVWRNGTPVWESQPQGWSAPAGARGLIVSDGKIVRYSMEGFGEIYSHPVNTVGESLYGAFALFRDAGEQITGITFAIGGSRGTDGLPGEAGKNGDTWYPYFAYADSPDGTINFTTGEAGSRSYVGTASGTSPTEPQIPGLYTWSRYLGPPFGMDTRGYASVSGRTIRKATAGTIIDWDSDAYSTVGYTGGAAASGQASPGDGGIMFGLNSDPRTDASYGSLDYAWFVTGDGNNLQIYESGTYIGVVAGGYDANTLLQVVYNGRYVTYLRNGDVARVVDAGLNRTFFFDSSLNTPGAILSNIDFKPVSPALPDIKLSASATTQKYNSDGSPSFYDISFQTTRFNSPVDPYFSVINSQGVVQLGWGRAIDHVNNYPGLFSSTGPDNLTIRASGQWSVAVIDADVAAGGKGFYTVNVATDLVAGVVTGSTVTKVRDGAKGADSTVPGPAALALTASVSSLTFLAEANGTLKSGQLAQVIVFTYTEGPNNVSTSVDWTVPEFSGCTGQMTSSGLVTFNSVTASGYVRVTGTYKGQAYTIKVPISLQRDPPPPQKPEIGSMGAAGYSISSTSYPSIPLNTVTVSVLNGVLRTNMSIEYSAAGQGNVYLEAMVGYRLAGTSNAWSYLPAVQGTQARINNNNQSEPINEPGSINAAQQVNVGSARYELGLFLRKYQGVQTGDTSGVVLADGS
ncbi:hypothetical protein [Sphingomonas sp. BK580]|uniref:hypothetical protein n=1 Tax=Sphingomonas sp. BK580 TaxID=2586972 RepID=UPI00161E4B6A|nr:hypothetical protein [Sphingomonas sp. BK580]MBB3691447.1 hypothetical protein [Sphingomonas sp. BK580]